MTNWKTVAAEAMPGIDWQEPKYLALSTEVKEGVQRMAEEITRLREMKMPASVPWDPKLAQTNEGLLERVRKLEAVAAEARKWAEFGVHLPHAGPQFKALAAALLALDSAGGGK